MNERWDLRVLRENPHLKSWTAHAFELTFTKRAVSPQVRDDRGYTPYDAGDIGVLYGVDPKYQALTDGERGSVRKTINQRPGIVMPRFAIPGAPEIFAQIRPFKFKELDPDLDLAAYGIEEDPGVFKGTWMHKHVQEYSHRHTRHGAFVVGERPRTAYRAPRQSRAWLNEHIAWEHDERGWAFAEFGGFEMVPGTEVHAHSISWIKHEENVEYALDHQQSEAGEHVHKHQEYAKYVYVSGGKVVDERAERPAKVVDVHPMARPLIQAGGRRCFFALEGLLKNDAILTQGEPVLNCGSVTLWDDPALAGFATEFLRGFEKVVIVPDSDWLGNEHVAAQARRLQERFREYGISAIVAAPAARCSNLTGNPACIHPHRPSDPSGRSSPDHKNGVDDWLGAGRSLDEMIAWEHPEPPQLPAIGRQLRSEERNRRVLEYLCMGQNPWSGRVRRSLRDIGKSLRMDKNAVWRAMRDLDEAGVIERVPPDDLYFDYDSTTTVLLSDELRSAVSRRLGDVS
jgi:hypothetical protein